MSEWGCRVCAGCGKNLDRDQFTRNQWSKQVGISRCSECIQEGVSRDGTGFETVRSNNATSVRVDISTYDEEGSFRYCSYGLYSGGQRTGQKCVAKWFKDRNIDSSFDTDLDAVQQATRIITSWNQSVNTEPPTVRINFPEVWTIDGVKCFVEPYIDNFFKINSNTGWTTSVPNEITDMLQALSHYSYHVSSGQFVLCDLQGGIYRDYVVLTDPVILSRHQRFGPTDLGPKGMSTFFYHHCCNRFCKSNWTRPRDQNNYFRPTASTTMQFGGYSSDGDSDSY
jgi:Alpha-kinase family